MGGREKLRLGRSLRRLTRDYEPLDTSLKGFHYLSFACLMLTRMFHALNATS